MWAVLVFCACTLPSRGQALDLADALPRWSGNVDGRAQASPGVAEPKPGDSGSWSVFHKDERSTVSIYYPQLDNPRIDEELAHWADVRLRTFVAGVSALGEGNSRYSMRVEYSIVRVSARFATVVFRISTETGGLLPDQGLATFTYDLREGRSLGYSDLFADKSGAIAFISNYARQELGVRLGRHERERISRGTMPSEENFGYFAPHADGLEIFFPPYQVASSSLGEQRVMVPLEKLLPFGPNQAVWGRKAGGGKQ